MTLYHCGRSRVRAGVRATRKRRQFGRGPKVVSSGGSSVSVVTRLRAGQYGVRIPAGKKYFSFLRDVLIGSGSSPKGVLSTGKKRPEREIYHSPTSAEIKNEWSYTSTLPIRLHRVPRATFTFTADNFTSYIIASWTHTKNAFIDSCKDPVSCSKYTLLKSTMLNAQLFLRLQPVPHREHRRSSWYSTCALALSRSDIKSASHF